jgi:hypothetical protein
MAKRNQRPQVDDIIQFLAPGDDSSNPHGGHAPQRRQYDNIEKSL